MSCRIEQPVRTKDWRCSAHIYVPLEWVTCAHWLQISGVQYLPWRSIQLCGCFRKLQACQSRDVHHDKREWVLYIFTNLTVCISFTELRTWRRILRKKCMYLCSWIVYCRSDHTYSDPCCGIFGAVCGSRCGLHLSLYY